MALGALAASIGCTVLLLAGSAGIGWGLLVAGAGLLIAPRRHDDRLAGSADGVHNGSSSGVVLKRHTVPGPPLQARPHVKSRRKWSLGPMASIPRRGHDVGMDNGRSNVDQAQALQSSAHALQREAGNVARHAGGATSMPALSITLAHLEEALDRLSVGMLLAARAVATSRERGAEASEGILPPDAEALCFHLRRASETLRSSKAACEASQMWTRRVFESGTDPPEPLEAAHGAARVARHSP